jgi:uncharacterized repeat protein (TIGR03803 family)
MSALIYFSSAVPLLTFAMATSASVHAGSRTTSAMGNFTSHASTVDVLFAFTKPHGYPYGALPRGGLLRLRDGSLLGTTLHDPKCGNCGLVFEVTPTVSGYSERTVYEFRGGTDGAEPTGYLVADRNGTLYGTTSYGGDGSCLYGCGTVFALTKSGSGYTERVLYVFQGGNDGEVPLGSVVVDDSGNIFGTTAAGGGNNGCGIDDGSGTVFELSPGVSGYTERLLHVFDGADGCMPTASPVLNKTTGEVYGTTQEAGSGGCGVAFGLVPNGSAYTYNVLHAFVLSEGCQLLASLILDPRGTLYGTFAAGLGTAFKLTPTHTGYTETTIYYAPDPGGYGGSWGPLVFGKDGTLFGTIYGPGGKVFQLTPDGSKYTARDIYEFKRGQSAGFRMLSGLVIDTHGNLYGVASDGGECGRCGTVFELSP